MARKTMFAEGGCLTALQTSDVEGLGVLYEDKYGRTFRYVKNASATALVAAGCCFQKLGASTPAGAVQRVLSQDASTGPATCLVTVAGGVPVTGIAASGAGTGDHGWVQVEGPKKVTMWQTATAVQQEPGCCAIMSGLSTSAWDRPYTGVIDSTNGGTVNMRCVQVIAEPAATGVATAASTLVMVRCLP